MKKIFIYTMLVAISGFTFAQSAQELLNDVSKKYKKAATYYIKFEYQLKNDKSGINEKSSGEIYAAKQKYNLNAIGIKQIFDGNKLYTIDSEVQEVVVTKPNKNSDDFLTPTKVIDSYKNGYKVSLGEKKKVDGKNIQYVKLTPESKSGVKYYLIGIDTNKKELYQYKEVNTENTVTTLTVKNYVENLIVSKAMFKFDKNHYKKKGFFITE